MLSKPDKGVAETVFELISVEPTTKKEHKTLNKRLAPLETLYQANVQYYGYEYLEISHINSSVTDKDLR